MKIVVQKTFEKIPVPLLLLLACLNCSAIEDTNIVAVGDWSTPVAGSEDMTGRGAHHPTLRGRLLLCESPKNHLLAAYLELQDCGDVWGSGTEVYCDMSQRGGCHLEFHNISGQPIPLRSRGTGGGNLGANWITLPSDSTLRLRVSPFASFSFVSTNDYFMSGTFTVDPTPDHTGLDVFLGKINLPPMKIPAKSVSGK